MPSRMNASAPLNCRPENICIVSVVVPELELRDVQRQIFAANFVETADDAAFENTPEAFNRVGMDCADDVLSRTVIDNAMRIGAAKRPVGPVSVGTKQTDFVRDNLFDEIFECRLIDTVDDAGDDVAL